MTVTNLIEELKQRDLFYASTDEKALSEHLEKSAPVTFYTGFDPTSDSLHVGSLLPIITMMRFQKAGHRPLAVVGGGTGMIGDPSGKSKERTLLDAETLEKNVKGIRNQLSKFLDMDSEKTGTLVLNNLDWLGALNVIDFLRDIGKHFSVNAMIAKDSVKARLENREQGISYTEFSYMIMQAYDFFYLNEKYGCTLQLGGSDQWGNITAGIDLIRRMNGKQSYGLTVPLLTTSSGTKFGKTEAGTVWLDPEKTSPYQFYQFWIRAEDADVIKFLKSFTFLSSEEIIELEKAHIEAPERKIAAKKLAEEMTLLVHGEAGLKTAENATKALFGGDLSELKAADLEDIFSDVPSYSVSSDILKEEKQLIELMAESGFVKSKGEARRSIKGGGIYLNNKRVTDMNLIVTAEHFLDGKFIVMRSGKKRYHIIKLEN